MTEIKKNINPSEKSTLSSNDLNAALWSAADEMRKVMAADVYKDYLLSLVFFKSLSDKILYEVVDLIENRKPDSTTIEEAQRIYESIEGTEDWEDLQEELQKKFSCSILPKFTFQAFYEQINDRTFKLSDLKQAFRDIEVTQENAYEGLFEDFDIDSKDLGATPAKRNEMISSVIKELAHIDFNDYLDDALGDAYEYLIAQFASESGKKAGEFYTPQAVSKLLARIVTEGQNDKFGFSVYDPTMGSGSLLLRIRNFIVNSETKEGIVNNKNNIFFFGQELKNQTFNLARMNMILHRVPIERQSLRNGDTLDSDWPTDEPTNFDAVVMNPPYSQKYDAKDSLLTDIRFSPYKKLPPSSKADYAFLLHGFYHLKNTGTMGIVLPHGVLFRGGSEGTIRQILLEKGNIYAVIGLPPGIFYSTGIPTCIVVLKKNHKERDVLFIDASKEFTKVKAKNRMDPQHIDKIFDAYKNRKTIEKFSRLVPFEEIKENEFNLNIPRYVDVSEPEPEIDIQEVSLELKQIDKEIAETEETLKGFFAELGLSNLFDKE